MYVQKKKKKEEVYTARKEIRIVRSTTTKVFDEAAAMSAPPGTDGPSGGQPIGGGPGAMQVMARVRPPADTPIIASACAARTGCDLSEPRGVPLALAAGSLFRFPNTERAVSSHTKRAGTEAGRTGSARGPRCTAPPPRVRQRNQRTR